MDGRVTFVKEHPMMWAVAMSGVLHLLFLFLYTFLGKATLFRLSDRIEKETEKRIAFEIIESPEESRVPPERAEVLSDKNALARDWFSKRNDERGLPYSEGVVEAKALSQNISKKVESFRKEERGNQKRVDKGRGVLAQSDKLMDGTTFSREYLLGRGENPQSSVTRQVYNQRQFSVEEQGGISFNTYAWDFAPYLLKLKRRIQQNIYPPPAFTYLGFGGSNVLRFRIDLSGHLKDLQVLGSDGERALVETSRKAIQVSEPFWPLPEDFPEEYLEVTARFYYVVTEN